ncbi:MAG: hypothetical protein HOW73_40145 [Polyangiaceae bacterium]|nr:hypothetical protein [Polyangiaceae bacterium]
MTSLLVLALGCSPASPQHVEPTRPTAVAISSAAVPAATGDVAAFEPPVVETANAVPAPLEPPPEPPKGVPAALYAELFVIDTSWKVESQSQFPNAPKATGSCRVAEVQKHDWGLASRVECKDLNLEKDYITGDPFSGWWAALPEGLMKLPDSGPRGEPDVTELILSASPRSKRVVIPDVDEPPYSDELTISVNGRGWCIRVVSNGDESAWWSVCVQPGNGFRGGRMGWRGGVSHEKVFTIR